MRLPRRISGRLRALLNRTAKAAAVLHQAVRLYATPESAGGDSLAGPTYEARVVAGDRTILDEFLATAIEELVAIRGEIEADLQTTRPVQWAPGTTGRIEAMAWRVSAGLSPFCDLDGPRVTG